ncbi:tyrosine-type recombinase/integrase [Kitasatospora sp. NPDC048545]|uniref:tyrosine-type recombinase/integrase n=1 Tax=Kitasatospora sp. NPDC048545 TaxID=3157208 RepID=UPI0033CAD94B
MFEDRTYKRCYCLGPLYHQRGPHKGEPVFNEDGTHKTGELGASCPKLGVRGHGVWYFFLLLAAPDKPEPIRFRRGGFRTQDDAVEECKKVWEQHNAGLDVTVKETVAAWLERWADNKKNVAASTIQKYREHIQLHIVPFIGHIDRKDLRKHHLEAMFKGINDRNTTAVIHREYVALLAEDCEAKRLRWREGSKADRPVLRASWHEARELLASERRKLRRVTDVPTQYKIRATLSTALSDAYDAEEVTKNWASLIKISKRQVKPMLWTPARVARWRETGEIPGKVMVWTPQLTGQFLDTYEDDDLYDLWHFMALRGPRRGEVCALPWTEIDLEAMTVCISRQVISIANALVGADPKAGSERVISIDSEAQQNLAERRTRQLTQRVKAGAAWTDTGLVWTQENGEGYHPDYLTRRFRRLVELADLPPVTLHGLRHGAACIAHRGGAKPKAVQEQLGHSSYQITMDTYTNIFEEEQRELAEAALNVVPRAGRPATLPAPQPAAAPVPVPAPAESPELRPAGGGRLTALRRARQRKAQNADAGAAPTPAPDRAAEPLPA